ncbi:ASCH domain-containing protein [Winogradskyella sp. 4-2091]
MKQTLIIFFLILISCKNEEKTQNDEQTEANKTSEIVIDQSVTTMWNSYIAQNPEFKNTELPEFDFFHNNKEDAKRLAELTANKKKQASSGLLSLYKQYNLDLPKVGSKQIITDFDGKAYAIIENKSIDTIPFNQISKEYAQLDMGTDSEPLKKWKKAHWDFFKNFLAEIEKEPTEDMKIVCVRFETVWPK